MRIQSSKIIEKPDFEPFNVKIIFEEERDVLKFLKEVCDIQYQQSEGIAFADNEIVILKGIEKVVMIESGSPSWFERRKLTKKQSTK